MNIFQIFAFLLCFCSGVFPRVFLKKGSPHVSTKNGILRGKLEQSRVGSPYSAFKGIRYAKVEERFEPPESIASETWTHVKTAVEFGPRCPQHAFLTSEYIGEEDCLYLNVYVPWKITGSDPLPVMVWIHGGGYTFGEGDSYGANYFMDEPIILVTLNYRLGALGFLSTGDGAIAGNMGMKDQVMALQWVQENIEAFGGDRHLVTIFGESAGGGSVHLLMVSPMTAGLGLFHRAILQSGSASCPWALETKETSLRDAKKLGGFLNCPTESSIELKECLKKMEARDIIEAQKMFNRWGSDPAVVFSPTMDEMSVPRKPNFLPLSPDTLTQQNNYNKVPIMMGCTGNEGLLIHSVPVLANEKLTADLNENWNSIAPLTFVYEDLFLKEELDDISEKVREFYFGDKPVGRETFQNLTNLYSDTYFVRGIVKDALNLAGNVDVFLYIMTYIGEFSLTTYFEPKEIFGVGHADDLQYLFKTKEYNPKIESELTSKSGEFSQNLVKLWASFAKTGKPDVELWSPISKKEVNGKAELKFFELNSKSKIINNPFQARLKFWNQIFKNHGKRQTDSESSTFASRIEL